jgi:hypothetical protein
MSVFDPSATSTGQFSVLHNTAAFDESVIFGEGFEQMTTTALITDEQVVLVVP